MFAGNIKAKGSAANLSIKVGGNLGDLFQISSLANVVDGGFKRDLG